MNVVLKTVAGLIALVFILAGVGCAALHRPDIPYATLRQTYAFPESAYQELPSDVLMHYRETGPAQAPVVILVHGFGASTHTWAGWTQGLQDRYRVISLDLPGHGLTEAPEDYAPSIERFAADVQEFVEAKGLERFVIAGSSMGGHVSATYALADPDRTAGLILVGAAGWWDDRANDTPIFFRLMMIPGVRDVLRDADATGFTRSTLRAAFVDQSFATEEMVTRYTELSRGPGHRLIISRLMTRIRDQEYMTPERLAPLAAIPTLVLHGEQDHIVPVDFGRRYHDAIPRSELLTWPNVGHLPQEEITAQSLAVIEPFLARALSPPPAASAPPVAAP
jgi:pimeloyl-ACP methyl ester carboxylesterase